MPLIVLAALSVVGGVLLLGDWITNWLSPVVGVAPHHEPPVAPILISLLVTLVVAAGVAAAWFLVGRRDVPREAPQDVSFMTRAARVDLYGDAVNDHLVVGPTKGFARGLAVFDRKVVDGVPMGTAASAGALSTALRATQTGFVRSYALSLFAGAALVLLALLVVNL